MISDEQIIAYVDGELDEAVRAEVETAAAADAEIAAKIAAHGSLRDSLMSAFAPIADEPVPQALLEAVNVPPPSATVLPFRPRVSRPLMVQIGAMAASLVVGIGLTLMMQSSGTDFAAKSGGLMARGDLARALSVQLASDNVAASAPRVGLSFRDTSGALCRTFETAANEGVACRDGKYWRIDVAARVSGKTEFAQAGSSLVMQAVESRIDGDPLDADGERAARDGGWTAKP